MNTKTETINRITHYRNRQRAAKFLGALASDERLFRMLQDEAGYSPEVHKEGWERLLAASNPVKAAPKNEDPTQQQEAIAQLDAWDGPAFSRIRAALEERFPEHMHLLLNELNQGKGVDSVHVISDFLQRLQALRDRHQEPGFSAETAAQDREVLDVLEARKIIGADIEAQLQAWIAIATDVQPPAPVEVEDESVVNARQHAALALHQWLNDWRGQARVVFSRRSDRIRLGLTQRRRSNDNAETHEAGETENTATAATPEETKAS